MLSTPHLVIGAAVGATTGDPLLGFVAGFASHLLMDCVPHTDSELLQGKDPDRILPIDYAAVTVDILVGVVFVLYFAGRDSAHAWPILAGALGGVGPDLISNVPFWSPSLRKLPLIKQFHTLHYTCNKLPWSKVPMLFGISTQFVALIIATIVLMQS